MSFPIVHSMVGYAVYRAVEPQKKSWKRALLCVCLASAADLDYIPGILVGDPLLFHHSITHSLMAAVVCGLGAALGARFFTKESFLKVFFFSFAIYASHPLLDLSTTSVIPLFWPFQKTGFVEHVHIFQSLPLRWSGIRDFAGSLLWNFACIQRFWWEIICLGSATLVFIVHNALRRLGATARIQAIPEKLKDALFFRKP